MRQLNFISLIHKELTGELSSEESLMLAEWLKSDQTHKDTYEEIKAIWNTSASYNAPFTPNVDLAFQKQLKRINSEKASLPKVVRMKPVRWVSAVVAGFIILLSALVIWNYSVKNHFSASDEIVNITLKDGTIVWLNHGSEITLNKNFNSENRSVTLKGEAYFDVKKNESLPFTIDAGEFNISVLGTEFNVRSMDFTAKSVTVREGRVQVSSSVTKVVIEDGQYARLNEEGILETGEYQDQNELSWKDKILIFDDTPFNDVIDDLSSYYNVKIKTNNLSSDCPITYTKPVNSNLETVLTVLSRAYDLNWTITPEGDYMISSVNCD